MYPCLVNTNVFIFRAIQTNEIDNWSAVLQLFLCQRMALIILFLRIAALAAASGLSTLNYQLSTLNSQHSTNILTQNSRNSQRAALLRSQLASGFSALNSLLSTLNSQLSTLNPLL